MFQDTITLGNVLTIAAMAIGGLSAWFLLRGDVTATKADVAELKAQLRACENNIGAAQSRIEDVRSKCAQELADYKLQASREYATTDTIQKVEERVVEAINRLGDRFDKYFDASASSARRSGSNRRNG